jgi:hypothetical protein
MQVVMRASVRVITLALARGERNNANRAKVAELFNLQKLPDRSLPFSPLASKWNGQHTQQCRLRYIYCLRKFEVACHASRTVGSHRCAWITFGMMWRQCFYSELMHISINANNDNNYDVDIWGDVWQHMHHLHNHIESVLVYAIHFRFIRTFRTTNCKSPLQIWHVGQINKTDTLWSFDFHPVAEHITLRVLLCSRWFL